MKSNKKTISSLAGSWGVNKQERWQQMKAEAIDSAVKLCSEGASLLVLHDFLVEKRAAIAAKLSPDICHLIRTSRKENPYEFAKTVIMNNNKYKDYYDDLVNRLDSIMAKSGNTAIPEGEFDTLFYMIEIEGDKIKAADELEITDDGVVCSTLMKIQMKDHEEESRICIMHTGASDIDRLMSKADIVYKKIAGAKNDLEKIKLIKELVWYLAHAMPHKRGSAAVCEMLFYAVLKSNGLTYEPENQVLPIDLEAIFSRSPAEFAKNFTINKDLEKIGEKYQGQLIAEKETGQEKSEEVEPKKNPDGKHSKL